MPRQSKPRLTDRERILSYVINGLASTALLCNRGNPHDEKSYLDVFGNLRVHVAYYRNAQPGDLVMGMTGFARGPHEYSIGFYVEPLPDNMGGAVIREIGSQRLCNYSNEDFIPIVGLNKIQLLEGEQYQFYRKVLQAFAKGGEYLYRFGGLDFIDKGAVIWVREVFGGLNQDSIPFSIEMAWNKRTSIKSILTAMRAGGYGTRTFEKKASEKAAISS